MEKKNNFFPLLLIGGGIAGATLLYFKGTKQDKESLNMLSDIGVGGSGDFLGSSGINQGSSLGGQPTVNIPLAALTDILRGYDSNDLGIEDYANQNASPDGYALPSDGGADPANLADNTGVWSFSDVADAAFVGLTVAGLATTAAKGAKTVASKVSQKVGTIAASTAAKSAAGTAAKSAAGTAASTAAKSAATTAASTAGKVAGTAAKVGGALGVLGLVDTFFEMTGVKDAHFSGGLTGNLQGVNTSLTVKTDEATKQNVGNVGMATTQRQEKIVSMLMTGSSSKRSDASPEETRIVNEALGTSGDVVKVTYGSGTSYVASTGKQIAYSGGTTLEKTAKSVSDYRRSQSAGAQALTSNLKSYQH